MQRSGGDAVILLGAAVGHAKAGHHLVEDEHDPVLVRQLAQPFEKPLRRGDDALHRLDDDPRDLVPVLIDEARHRVQVVVRGDQDLVAQGVRDPGRIGHRAREVAGPLRREAHQAPVAHAVVAALELQDLVAAPVAAGQAHRIRIRLRPGAHEADLLGAGHRLRDRLRELDGVAVVGEEGRAQLDLLPHRRVHLGMGVPGQHRPRADEVVDVLVAALVPHPAAASLADDDLRAGVPEAAGRHELPRLLDERKLPITSSITSCLHFSLSSRRRRAVLDGVGPGPGPGGRRPANLAGRRRTGTAQESQRLRRR